MANSTAPALPWGFPESTVVPPATDAKDQAADEAEELEPMSLEELGLAAGGRIEVALHNKLDWLSDVLGLA